MTCYCPYCRAASQRIASRLRRTRPRVLVLVPNWVWPGLLIAAVIGSAAFGAMLLG